MEINFFSSKAKIEKAKGRVSKSLNVFRKAYNEVEISIKDLETVVESSKTNIQKFEDKINEEHGIIDNAESEKESYKTLLKKFSEFLPLTSSKE
jgi:predicted  nucleic acid-binding Zn-ribbon protein